MHYNRQELQIHSFYHCLRLLHSRLLHSRSNLKVDTHKYLLMSRPSQYPRESASENGEYPAEILGVPSVIAWEGITVSGTFSTTNLFTAKINSDAKNKKLYEFSGTGSTLRLTLKRDGYSWNCFHDQNRVLYKEGGDTCYPQYYCQ
ncbi:uncharacterized protein RCO7_14025 [Rhynchosporium graminicola]|uniref:Uncharacterized protein n=1 Tax=Rhynchosporium graminicola TaxID=2792576 RepID=A0A1E1KFS1_9HELO|nr:uncharacterized protein RCO7_14025 [Rhynchosporium commune]